MGRETRDCGGCRAGRLRARVAPPRQPARRRHAAGLPAPLVYHASLNALKKGANATAYRSWVAQQIEQSCYAHYDPDDSEVIRKLYSQEIAGQIDAAVESLSPKCREVFRMSHIEGLSNREISERLGITLSTVENHIYNALKQLRQKLSHYKMLILLTMYILGRQFFIFA